MKALFISLFFALAFVASAQVAIMPEMGVNYQGDFVAGVDVYTSHFVVGFNSNSVANVGVILQHRDGCSRLTGLIAGFGVEVYTPHFNKNSEHFRPIKRNTFGVYGRVGYYNPKKGWGVYTKIGTGYFSAVSIGGIVKLF